MPPQSALTMLGILLGALMSVLGGYVCARIVRRDEYRVGGIMAARSACCWACVLYDRATTPST